MPDPICQQCGRKLGAKGDGRIRCNRCQPKQQNTPRMYLKDIPKIPFAQQYPPKPKAPVLKPIVAERLAVAIPVPTKPPITRRFCEECGNLIGPHFKSDLCRSCAHEPIYQPTEEEIRAACLEIQSGWDERTRYDRRTGHMIEDDEDSEEALGPS